MKKPEFVEIKNSRFSKINGLHKKVEKILMSCGEFKDLEEYHLISSKLSDVLTLLNKIRTDSLKDPV